MCVEGDLLKFNALVSPTELVGVCQQHVDTNDGSSGAFFFLMQAMKGDNKEAMCHTYRETTKFLCNPLWSP